MDLRKAAIVAALATSALSPTLARADALTVGGGWDPFFWVNTTGIDGGPFLDATFTPESFTFTLTGRTVFKITDAFYDGDQFDVVINGVDQGLTSTPALNADYTDNFDVAFADSNFSHQGYLLAPGTYVITGDVVQSPYGYGQGAVELSVPEPAAWAMMLLGFGAIGGVMRRGRNRVAASA